MTTAGPKYLGSPTATGFRLRISTYWPGTKLWVGLSDGIGREIETSAHRIQFVNKGNHVIIQDHLHVSYGRNACATFDPRGRERSTH